VLAAVDGLRQATVKEHGDCGVIKLGELVDRSDPHDCELAV
jgi:hypothetical protein